MSNNIEMHNKLMEEGYIEAAASKIHQKLSQLRESGDERLSRRWIWELIQNARDCANPEVRISVAHDNDHLRFSHSGKAFDYKNLMSLVTQISSKESSNEDTTGKFGTGFVTTHLLSEKVTIEGIYDNGTTNTSNFKFVLDRSGTDIHEIKTQVIDSLENLKNIEMNLDKNSNDLGEGLTTSFIYNLQNTVKSALDEGKEDFEKTVSYVLAFNKSIRSIQYNGVVYEKEENEQKINDQLKFVYVVRKIGDSKVTKNILVAKNNHVEIAVELEIFEDKFEVKPFEDSMPKLFCRFPLVGTESYFPVVVNSSEFSVEEQRDGIYEASEKNKNLMSQAVDLYENLIQLLANIKAIDIYNACFTKTTTSEMQREMIDRIRKLIRYKPIIQTNHDDFRSLCNEGTTDVMIWLPNCDYENIEMDFWRLVNSMKTLVLSTEESCRSWTKVFSTNVGLEGFCDWVVKRNDVANLSTYFDNYQAMYSWLEKFYDIGFRYKEGECMRKYSIFLNQKNSLTNRLQSLYIDQDIDATLITVLEELGEEIRNELLSKEIKLSEKVITDFGVKSYANKDIALKICNKVREIWVEETKGSQREEKIQSIFNKISLWFLKNPEEAKELFLDVYENRYSLSSREQLIDNFEFAEDAKQTLKEYNIESLEELRSKLDSELMYSKKDLDDLLVGLGIDDYDEILKSSDIDSVKHVMKHDPNKIKEALEKVQLILDRSKRNVMNHLNTLPEIYNVKETRELARTVYGDVYKYGQKIKIVVRPSDKDMIILFYQSELDVLDDNNYELWIDNGEDVPRQLTFGDVLMTTGIRVIPLKNLFTS
ncbi:ATP-binding protein [Paenibacillus sp. NPDC056722]|uniref:ATP-binding protein n=1 Tax=Paenibacillus sp. NPDC056722 TaxID=3345924 RepID=UPI00367D2213